MGVGIEEHDAILHCSIHHHTGWPRRPSPCSALDKVASRGYFQTVHAVGLKTLKNKLSEYVRLAARGETVLVTDRDRVVAELGPPREGRSPLLADAILAEAVRQGWLTPPALPASGLPLRRPVMKFRALLKELERDRDDR